jgi:hypothetical protein
MACAFRRWFVFAWDLQGRRAAVDGRGLGGGEALSKARVKTLLRLTYVSKPEAGSEEFGQVDLNGPGVAIAFGDGMLSFKEDNQEWSSTRSHVTKFAVETIELIEGAEQ